VSCCLGRGCAAAGVAGEAAHRQHEQQQHKPGPPQACNLSPPPPQPVAAVLPRQCCLQTNLLCLKLFALFYWRRSITMPSIATVQVYSGVTGECWQPPAHPANHCRAGWLALWGTVGAPPIARGCYARPAFSLAQPDPCLPADTFRFRLRARFPTTGSPPLANMVSNLLCSRACYSVRSAGLGSAKDSQQLL
jgi:hypothetical protein